MVGTCRLCRSVGALRDSHILPRWVFRRVLSRNSGNDRQAVLVENGTRRFTGDQDSEHLLCDACEQKLGRWENHVSKLAVQPDGALPALSAITLRASRVRGREAEADGTALGHETALFAASVLWRASVRSRPDISLGPYAEEFHAFVSETCSTLEHARLMVNIIDPAAGPMAAEIAAYPGTRSASGYREHQFTIPGLSFTFRVGGAVPSSNDDFCFIRTKRVWVVDGHDVAKFIWRKFQTATPLGKRWQARAR